MLRRCSRKTIQTPVRPAGFFYSVKFCELKLARCPRLLGATLRTFTFDVAHPIRSILPEPLSCVPAFLSNLLVTRHLKC